MTQLGEAIAATTITDPERPHWVQVEYKYANGRPVKGRFLATDSEGMTWAGTLNDQGQACLSGLPPGSVEFELVSEDIEDELTQMRARPSRKPLRRLLKRHMERRRWSSHFRQRRSRNSRRGSAISESFRTTQQRITRCL